MPGQSLCAAIQNQKKSVFGYSNSCNEGSKAWTLDVILHLLQAVLINRVDLQPTLAVLAWRSLVSSAWR